MPFDVLGCTRATLMRSTSVQPCPIGLGNLLNTHRDGDRLLQLLVLNEEFLVMMDHQFIVITSLPFVHTARRCYRLNNPVSYSDRLLWGQLLRNWKVLLTLLFRGSRSRNKVSVGEPAEGSIIQFSHFNPYTWFFARVGSANAQRLNSFCFAIAHHMMGQLWPVVFFFNSIFGS